ncbi:MAG TPA: RNA polymerase sigma factor [Terriglobales bacterium]|nr:RNA polymerase sigma factor [Terriglobales bacterium]
MTDSVATKNAEAAELTDDQVIERVLAGETALYELLMRRYNQRVYRAVRAVLRQDTDAEDVMQEAYVRAFRSLGKFEHRASFRTWVTKIAIHEALARLEKANRTEPLDEVEEDRQYLPAFSSAQANPEENMSSTETRALLEQAILSMPYPYRTVLMLRDVEEMTTAEAASALGLTEDVVKVRLHRARGMLRKELFTRVGATSASAFQFLAPRCDRVAAAVLARISQPEPAGSVRE